MQEIKHLILRVGTVANVEEYVFDGPMADAHIQGYLNQGFKVHTVHPGSVDQSTNSMSVFYVLIRSLQQPTNQGNAVVKGESEPIEDKTSTAHIPDKWSEVVPA